MKKLFVVFLLILAALQYRLWSPDGGMSEWFRLQNELAVQQSRNAVLEKRNEELKNLVLDLQGNTAAIETQAREVLHFIAPGETFFRVIPVSQKPAPSYLPPLPRTRLSAPETAGVEEAVPAAEAPP